MADYWERKKEMMEEATPLWSGPEDYGAWREKMLQNKQPWGMVPLAERKIGYGDDRYASDWHEEGAKPSGLYTDPRNAGLEGLFTENPELNWQNPSNKMFPWEPNYPAIEMGDRWMDRHMKSEIDMDRLRTEWINGMITKAGGGLQTKPATNTEGYVFERLE